MDILVASVISASAVMAISTISTGLGQGMAVKGAMEGMARQPEAANTIGTNLIIGLAFIESLTIYALVVALLLLYADPLAGGAKDQSEMESKVNVLKLKIEELQLQRHLDTLQADGAPAPAR